MTIPSWVPVTVSSLSVALALCAFIWQVRRARFNQSIDLLFRLENDFFGSSKRQQRVRAAQDLLHDKVLEAEPILDFFETMALLLRRGALDEELVAHTFFYWINHYYAACEQFIALRQKKNPLVWKDLTKLVATLRALQTKQLAPARYESPTPDEVASFLNEELTEA